MQITELTTSPSPELDTFKATVWPVADKEHYGENQPKFFRGNFTLIAKENDEIVGYVTVTVDAGVAQLEPLMVKTDSQGKGIGTQLLGAAEQKAKAMGAHKVWLETGLDWKAKKFYEKRGYVIRAELPNHTGGRDFVLMDKMI